MNSFTIKPTAYRDNASIYVVSIGETLPDGGSAYITTLTDHLADSQNYINRVSGNSVTIQLNGN